jgi:hypothetical protein
MINPGDLLVFVAVLVIVAAFLRVAHWFISGGGHADKEAAAMQREPLETRARPPEAADSDKITASQSASK